MDTGGAGISVSLAAADLPGKGPGYAVTVGKPSEAGTRYEISHFPKKSRSGRLVVRREKADLVCLIAEGMKDSPRELCRVPFTDGAVRQVRLFADAGGSPTALDVVLNSIRIRAEEITGGFQKREQPRPFP